VPVSSRACQSLHLLVLLLLGIASLVLFVPLCPPSAESARRTPIITSLGFSTGLRTLDLALLLCIFNHYILKQCSCILIPSDIGFSQINKDNNLVSLYLCVSLSLYLSVCLSLRLYLVLSLTFSLELKLRSPLHGLCREKRYINICIQYNTIFINRSRG